MSATNLVDGEEEDVVTEQYDTTEEDTMGTLEVLKDSNEDESEEIPDLMDEARANLEDAKEGGDDEDENSETDREANKSLRNSIQSQDPNAPGKHRGSGKDARNSMDSPESAAEEYVEYVEYEEEDEEEEEEEESDYIEFLKQPALIEDFMDNLEEEVKAESSVSSINILELPTLSKPEASIVAEQIIEQLEEDLASFIVKTGITFPVPYTRDQLKRLRMGLGDNESASSFDSNMSDVLPGEPSKLRMTYEKGVSVYTDLSLMHLTTDEMCDKEVQVNLHRMKKKSEIIRFSRYCQTLEMTFIPMDEALFIFKQMYPQLDDFKIKEPPSRSVSQEKAIGLALQADPNVDSKRKGPQIISLSNKKQLLQPLMDDYHKDERYWTGSRFVGEYKNRQVFKGRYDHPTGVKIESEFYDGHFQTQNHFGLVSYPRGDTFEGEWRRGRYKAGQITFCDGLKFASSNWKYCEPPDRRFKVERYYGIKPAGTTLFSDQYPTPMVPNGMYDTGDGFYNPKTGDVRGYDGFLLRQATSSERKWIEKNCRKVHEAIEHIAPNFLPERIPGSYVESQKRIPLTKKRYH